MKLLIGNDFSEELRMRPAASWWVQRVLWFAEPQDVLILPAPLEEPFVRYVTSHTKTDPGSLEILVPPTGRHGTAWLTNDRLLDPRFVQQLREALEGKVVDLILALFPDAACAALARALDIEDALPGIGFLSQGGGSLVNSKAIFRAVAGGIGIPIPLGGVFGRAHTAADFVADAVRSGFPVILKQEFLSGGTGNEILSPLDRIEPQGARRTVIVRSRDDVDTYFAEHWDELSGNNTRQLVIEQYFPQSLGLYAEFLITDDGVEFGATGESVSAPLCVSQVIPVQQLTPAERSALIEYGEALCAALYHIGYRGRLSADAILTPDGELLFTEYNGRVTGSTHIYDALGRRLVGQDYGSKRLLIDHVWPVDWKVASFEAAVDAIAEAGLAFDSVTRTGVVIASAHDPEDNAVMHCVIAEDLESAEEMERRVETLFRKAA